MKLIKTEFSQGSISFLDRLAFREKWKTDIKFGPVYVLFCISSSTILVIVIEFLELQARDTLQNICTGPISNASFVRLSISVKGQFICKTCERGADYCQLAAGRWYHNRVWTVLRLLSRISNSVRFGFGVKAWNVAGTRRRH
ncbi:hypothetical protein P8452_41910 [Trifolium repens]|nr:hypothetical protein P8452_41910 [Trifolium repens]